MRKKTKIEGKKRMTQEDTKGRKLLVKREEGSGTEEEGKGNEGVKLMVQV